MVEVSGLAVKTIPLFIKDNFGDQGLKKWIEALDSEAAGLYKGSIVVSKWFDIQKVFISPS